MVSDVFIADGLLYGVHRRALVGAGIGERVQDWVLPSRRWIMSAEAAFPLLLDWLIVFVLLLPMLEVRVYGWILLCGERWEENG